MEKLEDKMVARWGGKILVPTLCSSNRREITSLAPFTHIKVNVVGFFFTEKINKKYLFYFDHKRNFSVEFEA